MIWIFNAAKIHSFAFIQAQAASCWKKDEKRLRQGPIHCPTQPPHHGFDGGGHRPRIEGLPPGHRRQPWAPRTFPRKVMERYTLPSTLSHTKWRPWPWTRWKVKFQCWAMPGQQAKSVRTKPSRMRLHEPCDSQWWFFFFHSDAAEVCGRTISHCPVFCQAPDGAI